MNEANINKSISLGPLTKSKPKTEAKHHHLPTMGCFMGCFGLASNKKRRNSIRKILPRDQRLCSYEPLHSSDPADFNATEDNPEKISNSKLRCEVDGEEEKKGIKKTRKRVRFNLNVQTYEPVVPNDCSGDEEGNGERSKGDSVFDKKPEGLSSRPVYPSNYRYHNCVDSFEEEDEMGYGESDLEDEDYYTDDENDYEDDADDEDEEEDEVYEHQLVTPLLNPVVNLAQWKAVKAKPMRVKQQMKENVEADMDDQAKPLLKEIIVNASLSNWVSSSPKSFHGNGSSSKRSPIVDITNMENR